MDAWDKYSAPQYLYKWQLRFIDFNYSNCWIDLKAFYNDYKGL